MNTDNTLSGLSTMFTSEASYRTLVDLISDLDLELMGMNVA